MKAAPPPAAQPAPVAVVAVTGGTPADKAPAKAKPAKKFADVDVKAVGTSIIKVLSRNPDGSIKNPKAASGAPAKRFALYADGITVEAAKA